MNVNEGKVGGETIVNVYKTRRKSLFYHYIFKCFVIFFLNAHLMKTLTSLCKIEQNEVHIVWGGQTPDVNVYNR